MPKRSAAGEPEWMTALAQRLRQKAQECRMQKENREFRMGPGPRSAWFVLDSQFSFCILHSQDRPRLGAEDSLEGREAAERRGVS